MFNTLAPIESVKISKTYHVSFYFCNNRFEGAIFLTLVRSQHGSGLPLTGTNPPSARVFLFLYSKINSNEIKTVFNNINNYFNLGNTHKKNAESVNKDVSASGLVFTTLRATSLSGMEAIMIFNQIEIPLSRATTKAKNRFGKRQIKSFEQWKLDRASKARQERICEQRRMIQGWLL